MDTARRYMLASNLLGLLGLAGLTVATAKLAGPWWALAGASGAAVVMAYSLQLQAVAAARQRRASEARRTA